MATAALIVSFFGAPFIAALAARVSALESQLVTVLALAPFLNLDTSVLNGLTGPHLIIEGVNVHIRSGAGASDDVGALTGLGNLIIGREHRYSNFGGLVAGFQNTISGQEASVSGGIVNEASGFAASVSGGTNNTASGGGASISGGEGCDETRVLGSSVGNTTFGPSPCIPIN